ncbi:MAG: ankyrin repeat domain-containing protein [Alphaproteobacteria bacterium]
MTLLIHEEEREVTLTMAFARALRKMDIYPSFIARKQMVNAITTGDSVSAAKMLRKRPQAAIWQALGSDGADHTMLELALGEGKFNVAAVMLRNDPQLLTHDFGFRGAPPNRTILMQRCIMSGLGDEIKFLIDQKADVHAKDGKGDTPLHFAARRQKEDAARILLNAQADVNVGNADGVTPVMEATKGNESKLLDMMIGAGAHINAIDKSGKNAVMHAFHNSNVAAVRRLMDLGAAIDFKDPAVATLCRVATSEGDIPFVIALGDYEQKAAKKDKPFDYAGTLEKGLAEGITVAKPIKLKGRTP